MEVSKYIISMDYRKKLKTTIAVFKSATAIIKATVSTKRNAKLQIAILRATAPNLSAPPSEEFISAVLSAGRQTACACLQALMDRLHATHKASVALKCLFTIHSIVTTTREDGSNFKIILQEYSFGGRNFLNLSRFRDQKAAELSCWVRWYASVVEKKLMVSRFWGHFLNPNSNSISATNGKQEYYSKEYLLNEMDSLVDFVEVICSVPESLHLQRNDLVYEVVRRVGEDYRIVQREIFARVTELRAMSLSVTELAQFLNGLKRFEDCKRMVRLLFVNRARNDALWEMVSETKMVIVEMMKEMGEIKLLEKIMGWEYGSNSKQKHKYQLETALERQEAKMKRIRHDSRLIWSKQILDCILDQDWKRASLLTKTDMLGQASLGEIFGADSGLKALADDFPALTIETLITDGLEMRPAVMI